MSDLSKVITDLIERAGYSEQGIADALNQDGVEVNQSTINRIKLGVIAQPRFDVGVAILRLSEKRRAAEARKAS